jgi:protein CpxP
MKKIIFACIAFTAITLSASAQGGGGFNRRTPEERAASIHEKIDSAFKLDADKMTKLDTAMVALFKAQDTKRQEMMAGGMPDRETFMAEMKKFTDARDEILKALLTTDQFGIWKDKIEPSMRPQRPQGGGNR